MVTSDRLPPGQSLLDGFPRFGLPAYMQGWPAVPANLTLAIGGLVDQPLQLRVAELMAVARTELTADFHCVATWSRTDVRWGGVPFRDVYEQIIVRDARPDPAARWVRFRGLDGYFATLQLDDALAADVLLADMLAGEPLPLEHGAPLRLVAPAHYGYKSVKHLAGIELRERFSPKRAKAAGFVEHPRARALAEERSRGTPGPVVRELYAAMLPHLLHAYEASVHPPGA